MLLRSAKPTFKIVRINVVGDNDDESVVSYHSVHSTPTVKVSNVSPERLQSSRRFSNRNMSSTKMPTLISEDVAVTNVLSYLKACGFDEAQIRNICLSAAGISCAESVRTAEVLGKEGVPPGSIGGKESDDVSCIMPVKN